MHFTLNSLLHIKFIEDMRLRRRNAGLRSKQEPLDFQLLTQRIFN